VAHSLPLYTPLRARLYGDLSWLPGCPGLPFANDYYLNTFVNFRALELACGGGGGGGGVLRLPVAGLAASHDGRGAGSPWRRLYR